MSEDDRLDELVDEARAARKIAQTALQEKAALESRVDDLCDEIESLREENDRLTYRVAELEATKPNRSTPYEQLSRKDKVDRVCEELMLRADGTMSGCAELDYQGVMSTVFENEPSVGHVYKLMKLAGKRQGFDHKEASSPQRVTVDIADVKDSADLSRVNKTAEEGGV
jgi:DNA repair ATPase RecN